MWQDWEIGSNENLEKGVKHWNRLPGEVVHAPSQEAFKIRLEKLLATWSNERYPYPHQGVGTTRSLKVPSFSNHSPAAHVKTMQTLTLQARGKTHAGAVKECAEEGVSERKYYELNTSSYSPSFLHLLRWGGRGFRNKKVKLSLGRRVGLEENVLEFWICVICLCFSQSCSL